MLFRKRLALGSKIPEYHPTTRIRDWGGSESFLLSDALTGVAVFGATGSGKTSGPSKHLAYGYLSAGFGGLVLCAKKEERTQWEKWAHDTGRTDDLVIIEKDGVWRFNFLDWETTRMGGGAGLTINLVALLDEIAGALASKAENGGSGGKFWQDALHYMNINLVDLPLFAQLPVSLPLLRSIANSAPVSPEQVKSEEWQASSACAAILREADAATLIGDSGTRADFDECRNYWLVEYPNLSEKTRSIINLSLSMLVRPFITRPLRALFCAETTVTPEHAFDGKIILVDLPIQEYRLAGRVAQMVWKYCFQISVLRRTPPSEGYLRPVFIWADEAQNFVTAFDAEYQAVARSAGGATVYLTQNYESYKRILGDSAVVDSLLGNLQTKIFCQNASPVTNDWASRLLGERFVDITGSNVGRNHEGHSHSGISTHEQKRYYIDPSRFTTLKRGGPENDFLVEALVYAGGKRFRAPGASDEHLPYTLLTFRQ